MNSAIFFVQLLVGAAAKGGKGFVAGDRQEPGRNLRAALEPVRLPPDVEEDFAHQILGRGFVTHEAEEKAENLDVVAAIERLQRVLVAGGDGIDKRQVRGVVNRALQPVLVLRAMT